MPQSACLSAGGDAKAKRAMPKCLRREFQWGFPKLLMVLIKGVKNGSKKREINLIHGPKITKTLPGSELPVLQIPESAPSPAYSMGVGWGICRLCAPTQSLPSQAPTLQTYVVYVVESSAVSTAPLFRHVLVSRPSGVSMVCAR